ncbi:lanthionine synthetase C family protein [Streptosporangium sp. NPDC023615]|uniref:lanthionine synthetase C family protein n=1 Tax=Streptosporangium sp. NPDC023615 TaxID=3154794 RepID=UPI003412D749
MTGAHPARDLAVLIADRLAHPDVIPDLPVTKAWWRQLLAHGAPGIALLHIELAAAEVRPWRRVHDWLTHATRIQITTGPDSHLFYGAPALAHALACAAATRSGSYEKALAALDAKITADARRRVDAAHARIDGGHLPAMTEFDTIRGLAGIGSYLLRRAPDSATLRAVLKYLVRLTEPVTVGGETLPGWWTTTAPSARFSDRFPGGHGNCGMAHGIGGPLALLALAALRDVTVDGHREAIGRIIAWYDRWRRDTDAGPVWPYWVTRSQLRADRLDPVGPLRPSWCYGTAGVGRALQLAALATGDAGRRNMAEDALVRALADPGQLAATTDSSLCHGYAGLAHIAARAADDAVPAAATRLRALIPALLNAVHPPGADPRRTAATLRDEPGLLDGTAGTALASLTPSSNALPRSGWDACLLII